MKLSCESFTSYLDRQNLPMCLMLGLCVDPKRGLEPKKYRYIVKYIIINIAPHAYSVIYLPILFGMSLFGS